ncbi:glycosyltransferase [Parabacteroides timonensis]|uniref:glycosyltransferase n=1 Tax=Parabacteroides timonensis TaxID=1871013 RepID=UPI00094F0095|nr:glycosyltransferase [Parabacteroides timonensis]
MKTILLLVPTIVGHGQERQAVLAAEILKSIYDVKLVVFDNREIEYSVNVDLISLDLPALLGIKKIVRLAKRVYKLKKLRNKLNVYAVISFGTSANLVNSLSRGRGKTIISYRGFAALQLSYELKLCCNMADKIFCISEGMSNRIAQLYPQNSSKISTIYNGLDIDGIKKLMNEKIDYKPTSPSFVTIGRLEPVKGHKHILKAFKEVLVNEPMASLTIIGEGSLSGNLECLAKELGIAENVFFVGKKTNPFPWIKQCDICVQASITEGFLNVITEAGVCGVPTISTDCPSGPREILNEKLTDKEIEDVEVCRYGVLVPSFLTSDSDEPQKESILAKAMLSLWRDKILYKSLQVAMTDRVNDFSLAVYKSNLLDIIR